VIGDALSKPFVPRIEPLSWMRALPSERAPPSVSVAPVSTVIVP
jgi:hypothetical protein